MKQPPSEPLRIWCALLDRVNNIEKVVRTIRPLMISQPNTPHLTPIPNTTREIEVVEEELVDCDIRARLLNGRHATIARVSSEMEINYPETITHGWLGIFICMQTSSGDEKLSEEAVHLGAGMLAAGYQGVIATMWSIQDHYGPEIAKDFYAHLLRRGGTMRAAHALHYAMQRFRKKYGDSEASLIAWVP
ncbi:hypothetical protein CPB84DRAFT_1811181 [Gymnopilus junonius]|uniref:CHAT domain-containing protein n=1 Tax=Gymnopilus junonius TaxID=109634 RepID=A0A9P5N6E6_GYMJU|nr:hypothetical protein CPB84DRAFT_1811181 [Gymnopilus junonius]